MGNENQETTVVDLEGLSLEELEALEDADAAAIAAAPEGEEPEFVIPDDGKTLDKDESDNDEQGTQESASTEEPGEGDQPTGDKVQTPDDVEDVVKHVSPPSKWAAERARKRELQSELEIAKEETAVKTTEMETELTKLKGELKAIKDSLKVEGITFKDEVDANAFSEEKLAEIRDEFGDELADMMEAASKVIKQREAGPSTPTPAQAETDSGQGKTTPQGDPVDDPAFNKALEGNESLAWWRSLYNPDNPNDPKNSLWDKAVAQDKVFLDDPEYTKLSYEDRFKKVVKVVSEEVETNAKTGKDGGGDTYSLPPSLSGGNGLARNDGSMEPVDKVLAADTPEKQMEIYKNLSEADRDKVDIALDI